MLDGYDREVFKQYKLDPDYASQIIEAALKTGTWFDGPEPIAAAIREYLDLIEDMKIE